MFTPLNPPTPPTPSSTRNQMIVRLIIAILWAVIAAGLAFSVYEPASLIAGMLLDSCSGEYGFTLWEIWLRVLWLGVLIVCALGPPLLITLGRRWRWVALGVVVGLGVSVTWYIAWFFLSMLAC